ncbi:hypothetical protein PF010_g16904, partial [Phytophthora fragariae]
NEQLTFTWVSIDQYTDPAASTFTWVSTNIQTQQRQGSRSVSATMARTKKTSHILRAIAKSESQISGDESSCYVSTRSETMESAAESDGIPPAQGSVNSKTSQHEKDDDSDGKPPQEEEPSSSSDSQSSSSSESDNESCEFASGTSGGSERSRKRAFTDCSEELHFVPALKRYHKNWKKFESYLRKYQHDTMTILAVSETVNVHIRNRQIAKHKVRVGKLPSELPLVPESLDPYQRVYICTHGWKNRIRSKGVRPLHSVSVTGCQMRFVTQLIDRASGKWRVQVKLSFYGHNHPVSQTIYGSYPSVRQIPTASPVMKDVELMVASGSRSSRIYHYIRENSPHRVEMRDVYNLVAKIKKSGNKLTDEDQVAELLVKFNMRADGNVARIDENSRGQTAVVSLSSEHMRKLYHRFPELVLIDCTHKTNSVMEEFIASTSSTGCAAHTAGLMAIPYASIPPRWLRVGTLEEELPEVDVPLRITTQGDEVKRKKQMTEQDKYKSVQSVFGRITTELTDLPDGKFSDALGQLEQWWGNLRRGTVGIPSSQGATFDSEILSTQVAAPDKTESEDADVTATEGKGADSSPVPVDEPSAVSKSAGDQPESSPKKAAKTTAKSGVSPFNYRAPKLGRPRKDRAAADAKRGAERKEYNNGAKLRTALRGGDVTQVEEFLKSRKPPLVELSSYLNTFETRYRGNNGTKMTVAKRVPEPLCAMYLLPEKIVNTAQMAIEHAIPYGDTMDVSTPPDTSAECWIVDIDGIGVFTQRQLMAMQFILNLSKTCKNGMQCYSWLMSKVDMLFDGEGAASLAERMLNAWPCKDLPGFDLEWSHLYCAREKCWLHDNFIHAFSTTLAAKYNNNATIFLPLLKMPAPDKEKGKRIPPLTLSALSCAEKDMVFMPMNINSSHWTCLVVDHPKQTVYCYDSLAKRVNQKLLSEMAEELVKRCLPQPYTIATVLSPIQKDSDNCGLFICLYFWRRLFKEAGNDYSKTGLLRRRWDVLRAIVNFSDSSKDAK